MPILYELTCMKADFCEGNQRQFSLWQLEGNRNKRKSNYLKYCIYFNVVQFLAAICKNNSISLSVESIELLNTLEKEKL